MNQIRPFRGWRHAGDVSKLIAPPYDILSAQDKQALLAGSPDNIVGVDMPHVPPKELGPDAEYQGAARKLAAMRLAGTLVQEDRPALYAYSQTYAWAGKQYTRKAIICGVRATEFYQGVWPHEHTFAGPKADRLRLTELTHTQLSPIFAFYEDASGASDVLWDAADGEPVVAGDLRGVQEKMWAVTDPDVIAKVCAAMVAQPIFIADGHHRYTTALNYANALRAAGKIDERHEANYVLFALVAMDDPGLIVLPTHRLISGLQASYDCAALAAETRSICDWREVRLTDALLEDADAFLKPFGPHAMAFLDNKLKAVHVGRLTDAGVMKRLAPDQPDAWRELDVAILHKLLLDKHLAGHADGELSVNYTASGREAVEALKAGQCQMAAMTRSTPLSAVKDIALVRATMPHKSTYFHPKLATGMVLKPLE